MTITPTVIAIISLMTAMNSVVIPLQEGVEYQEPIKQEVIEVVELNPEVETPQIIHEVVKFNVNDIELSKGKLSEDALRLKRFLIAKGYIGITESYYFDETTHNAVMDYQKKNGLKIDGIVGKGTFGKINEDMGINNINIPKIQMSINQSPTTNQWIIINKSNNTLYHLKGKEIINKYHVATGKEQSLTPEGKFTIVVKSKNPAWGGAYGRYKPIAGGAYNNPLGKRWMGISKGGGGEYGIHGNYAPNSIGTYASLGCIRMKNEDVEYLFDIIPKGTIVWIGQETKLKEFGVTFN